MPLGIYFGNEVGGIVERVIILEKIGITGDLLPERHQRYSLLSEYYLFHENRRRIVCSESATPARAGGVL